MTVYFFCVTDPSYCAAAKTLVCLGHCLTIVTNLMCLV